MAQQEAGVRIVAGAVTTVALGAVWLGIVTSLPTGQELSTGYNQNPSLAVAASLGLAASGRKDATPPEVAPSEPELDLTIPGVPPAVSSQTERIDREAPLIVPPVTDARSAQVVRLKCEAEIEQLCPESAEGSSRTRCLERKAPQLAPPCQQQLQERFVKWKEERSRLLSACQEDARRLCIGIRPGDGRVMQCLQDHAQDVSDRCYQTLPKGALLFRQ